MDPTKRDPTSPEKMAEPLARTLSTRSSGGSFNDTEPILRTSTKSPRDPVSKRLTRARRSLDKTKGAFESDNLEKFGSGSMCYNELPDDEVMAALAAEHEFRLRYTCKALELLCFVVFGLVFFIAVGLQTRASHSYGVNNALFQRIPVDPTSGDLLKQFASMDDMVTWLNTSLVSAIWADPGCGNGVCDSPSEVPAGIYADRGCLADCGDVRDAFVEVLLIGSAAAAYLADNTSYPVQMCWDYNGASGCISGSPRPLQIKSADAVLFDVGFYLDQDPDADWYIIVPFEGQEAQVSLVLKEQTVLVFGGPDGFTHIPEIKTWWLWPSAGNRTVLLDGRALLDNDVPSEACISYGYQYTVPCQVPFPGTILPPGEGCCTGPNNATIALKAINPRKLYQQLLLTTPRVIGAADKQSNRVIAGLLFRQDRRAYSHKDCGDYQHVYNKTGQFFYHQYGSRYGVVDPWCEHYIIDEEGLFGIDPVFLPSSSLYNASLNPLDFYQPSPSEISPATGLPFGFYDRQVQGGKKGNFVLFDINLSANRAQDWLNYLVDGRFFHRQTKSVSIQLLTYNGIYQLFAVMDVRIDFTDAESLLIVPRVESLSVPSYSVASWAFQIIFFLGVFFLVLKDVARMLLLIQRGKLLRAYTRAGRWVVTLSNLLFLASIALWATVFYKTRQFHPSPRYNVYNNLDAPARFLQLNPDPLGAQELAQAYDDVWSIVRVKKAYITLTGINMVLTFIRVLGLMHFHPRLGMVTRTLQAALPDLVAFFVIWCVFMTVYATMGLLIFGDNVYQLSTFALALNQCFVMSLGDTSINQALLDVATTVWDTIPSRMYYWSFNFLGTFIILQFLVAIVVDVLNVVRVEYARLEAQTLDWKVELNWLLGHWRHIRSVGMLRSLVLAYRAEQRAAQEGTNRDDSWLKCSCFACLKGGRSKSKLERDPPKKDWRSNVLVVDGVEVPQAQVKRLLERLILEKEGRKDVSDLELQRLTEFLVACFGDAPSNRDPECGASKKDQQGLQSKEHISDKHALALVEAFLTDIRGQLSDREARAKILEGDEDEE